MTERRRLTEAEAAEVLARATPIPSGRGASPVQPAAISGREVGGGEVVVAPPREHRLLLLFLAADCSGCDDLVDAAGAGERFGIEESDELLVLLRAEAPSLSTRLGSARAIVAPGAFRSYRVTGPPFFALVDPAFETVATEGVAWGVASIVDAVAAARAGSPVVELARLEPNSG